MRKMILLLITVVIMITGYNEFINADNKPAQSDSTSSTVAASEDETDKDKDTKVAAVSKDLEDKSKQISDKNKKSSKDTVVSKDKTSKNSKGSNKQVSTTETPTTESFNKESSYSDSPCNEAPSNELSTTEALSTEAPSTEAPDTESPTTEAPCPDSQEPTTEAPPATEPASVSYSPQNVVAMATSQCIAGGMIRTTDNLDNLLANGSITQEEYNEYYPYDGLGYYSVFVETDLNKASTTSGALLGSEAGIADYISGMLLLESNPYFLIEYAGTTDCGGQLFYEFRCYR